MSLPSIVMEPFSGLSSPMRHLRKTDLPVPDGPSSTLISPAGRVRLTSSQMVCRPKRLVRFSTRISTPTARLHSKLVGQVATKVAAAVLTGRYPRRIRAYRSLPRPGFARVAVRRRGGRLSAYRPFGRACSDLLERDLGAGTLEGGLRLLGRLLGDLLQHRLRGAVHEVLGLLQAEGRERAHLLDDLDLLVAGLVEDDVELVLVRGLLGSRAATATTGGRGGRDGNGSSGGDAEGLL